MPRTLLFGRTVDSLAFLAVTAFLVMASYRWADFPIATWVHGLGDEAETIWFVVTQAGDSAYYFAALGAYVVAGFVSIRWSPDWAARLHVRAHLPGATFALAAILGTGIISNLLKIVFSRPRPSIYFRDGSTAFNWFLIAFRSRTTSFPSGHATTIWTVALVAYLLFRLPAWPLIVAALVVSASRIFLELHFLGDSIGGAATALFGTSMIFVAWQRFLTGRSWADLRLVTVAGK